MTTKCIQTFGGVLVNSIINHDQLMYCSLKPEMRIPEISKGLVVSMDLNQIHSLVPKKLVTSCVTMWFIQLWSERIGRRSELNPWQHTDLVL